MKNNDIYYLQLAYKTAQLAFLNNDVPVGAVLTNKKNNIFINRNTNSKNKSIFEHAELKCLKKIENMGRSTCDYTLYSTLLPCPMCSGAIYMFNIRKIFIGSISNLNTINEYSSYLLEKRIKNYYLARRCSRLLRSFFLIRR